MEITIHTIFHAEYMQQSLVRTSPAWSQTLTRVTSKPTEVIHISQSRPYKRKPAAK
jgi:hypothetical protein